ncbi:efflux RND transporter periplasmic adaptor subunit [Flavobacteriaceae bacterium M23B6Z8]
MRKKTGTIIGILMIVTALALISWIITKDKDKTKASDLTNEIPVETLRVKTGTTPFQIEVTGKVQAKNKIAIYSEVQGKMLASNSRFRVGNSFRKGAILVSIENREQQVQVQSAKSTLVNQIATMLPDMEIEFPEEASRWENYILQFDLNKPIKPLPEIKSTKAQLFITGKNILKMYYDAKQLEEKLFKYQIFAPFEGTLIQVNIKPGGLVRSSQLLGEYMNTEWFEVELPLPVAALEYVKIDTEVLLTTLNKSQHYTGKIKRINQSIDAETQTVKTIVEINDSRLKDGQYLTSRITGKPFQEAFTIHASLLAENQFVYLIKNNSLQLQQVVPLNHFKDSVTVSGLEDNMLLLKEPIVNAYPGMKVTNSTSQ